MFRRWKCVEIEEGIHRGDDYVPPASLPALLADDTYYGLILTRAQWGEIKAKIDAFFAEHDDDYVDAYNRARIADQDERTHEDECRKCYKIRHDRIMAEFPPAMAARLRDGKPKQSGYIYLLKAEDGHYKIGRAKDVESRFRALSVQLPFAVTTVYVFADEDYKAREAELHKRFAAKRANGEWFKLDEADVEYICSLGAPAPARP